MKKPLFAIPLAIFAFVSTGQSATYHEIFTESDAITGDSNFLDTVATNGSEVVAFTRASSSTVDATEVRSYDQNTNMFTNLVNTAQWNITREGGVANGFEAVGSNGARITDSGDLRFFNFFDNSFYNVHLATGTTTTVAAHSDFNTVAGVTTNLSAFNEVLADGSAYVIDFESDSVLSVSSTGVVGTGVSATTLSLGAGTSFGGIGFDGTNILIGSNTNDNLIGFSGGAFSEVLSLSAIEAVTDDIDGRAGFGDIFYAPDGLVYFYENDSDYLLSYDPNDPTNTLGVVISEADLIAGPNGSDAVNQLSWFNNGIAWTDASDGFYALNQIPEPSSAMLSLLGSMALLRRKRS